MDGLQQFFRRQLFFLQHHAVALFFERTGIQNLVAAAGVGRQGDQQVGLCKCADFTDCIGAGTGDDKVCQGKKIRQFLFDILVLHVAFGMFQGWIDLVFAAQVNDLEIFQKFRKDLTDRTVDGNGSQAASDDQNDRFFRGEAAEFQRLKLIAGEQLLADRGSGQNRLVRRQTVHGFRKITADF